MDNGPDGNEDGYDHGIKDEMEAEEVDDGNVGDEDDDEGNDGRTEVENEHKCDDGNDEAMVVGPGQDNDGNADDGIDAVMELATLGISDDKKRESNDELNEELDEFGKQMDEIIGGGWNERNDEISNIAKRLMKCLINKIYMSFHVECFPDYGTVREG